MTMGPEELERRIRNGEPIPTAAVAGNGADPHNAPQMVQVMTPTGPAVVPVEIGTFMLLAAIGAALERIERLFIDAQGEGTDATTDEGATPPATGSGLLEA